MDSITGERTQLNTINATNINRKNNGSKIGTGALKKHNVPAPLSTNN